VLVVEVVVLLGATDVDDNVLGGVAEGCGTGEPTCR